MGSVKMHYPLKKQSLTAAEVFADFSESCQEQFAFLEKDFGLSLIAAQQVGHEFNVVYANPEYKVTIYFEYPGPPWIAMEKKDGNRWKRKGLHQLYKRALKKELPSDRKENETIGEPYDLTNLSLLSDILHHHWSELISAF